MTLEALAALDISGLFELLRRGGVVVAILAAMSIFGLALVLVKCWQFVNARVGKRKFITPALDQWRRDEREAAIHALRRERNPIADALAVAMGGVVSGTSIAIVREEAARVGARHLSQLRRYFRPLEVIGSTAPLLGLLGTVIGMIKAFQQLANAGNQVNPSVLSNGIWEALLTTAVGLVVAIPAVVALNWCERVVERLHEDMQDALTRFFTQHEAATLAEPRPTTDTVADGTPSSTNAEARPARRSRHATA